MDAWELLPALLEDSIGVPPALAAWLLEGLRTRLLVTPHDSLGLPGVFCGSCTVRTMLGECAGLPKYGSGLLDSSTESCQEALSTTGKKQEEGETAEVMK